MLIGLNVCDVYADAVLIGRSSAYSLAHAPSDLTRILATWEGRWHRYVFENSD